jgi:hypothetical protein
MVEEDEVDGTGPQAVLGGQDVQCSSAVIDGADHAGDS